MKMENEEEKNEDFSTCLKYFNLYFSEALNLADFRLQIFHIFLRSKVTALHVGPKWSKNGRKKAKWNQFLKNKV